MTAAAQALRGATEMLQSVVGDLSLTSITGLVSSEPSVLQDELTPHGHYELAGLPEWKSPTSCIAYLQGKTGHTTRYGPSVDRLKLEISPFTSRIARIRITDAEKQRWELPQELVPVGEDLPADAKLPATADYDLVLNENTGEGDIGFAIVRKSDGVAVFDSRGLPISFCEHYMEVSTRLPTDTLVYGLGEVTGPFLREPGSRFAFWARDAQTPLHENAYSSLPMFAGMHDGKAFGVYLHNSNALDMVYGSETITYKVVGGVLDFFVFLGETYEDVTVQYQQVTGFPQLPPYWSLGYHQCRWYYDTTEKLEETRRKNVEADIPVDVFWLDIDYMIKYQLFTLDEARYPKFADYVRSEMHKNNHKLVAILDPGIKCNIENYKPWSRGVELDVFIKNGNTNKDFVGKVWPGHVVFPDWTHPKIQEYWTEMLRGWFEIMPVDGIWHDMNEASNFVNGDVWEVGGDAAEDEILIPTDEETVEEMAKVAAEGIETGGDDGKRGAAKPKPLAAFDASKPHSVTNPPYSVNHGGEDWPLSARSISVESYHHGGVTEYDIHNLFGHLNSKVTYNSMTQIRPDERPFILTRSAFAGTGKFASKWLGDNFSNWDSMKHSISGIFNMQLFGIPHIGADIGGFNGAPSKELLLRWFQLGAMYPFCRNHNMPNTPPQEAYISLDVNEIAKTYLTLRYRILPFWYTAFARVAKFGGSVVQPVWAVYPPQKGEDTIKVMKENNDAFLINRNLLVVPVVTKGQTQVPTWIPAGLWYDASTNGEVIATTEDEWMTLEAPLDRMPIYFRGGSVIPMHYNKSGKTTVDFRDGGLSLVVALGADGTASGDLYLDDGLSFSSGKSWITLTATLLDDAKELKLELGGEFGYRPTMKQEITVREVVVMAASSHAKTVPVDIVLSKESSGKTIKL
ncbi:Alpha-glucosidase [Dactylellina cionopaga]|nr:Alpha-glucosidase [Dactylellina cionopaga]